MACCEKHDRMDLVLDTKSYNDHYCGTPTEPDGEQRYCCRNCPSKSELLKVRPSWASSPRLMRHLTEDERRQVLAEAVALGPLVVDIQVALPAPPLNAVTPTS